MHNGHKTYKYEFVSYSYSKTIQSEQSIDVIQCCDLLFLYEY